MFVFDFLSKNKTMIHQHFEDKGISSSLLSITIGTCASLEFGMTMLNNVGHSITSDEPHQLFLAVRMYLQSLYCDSYNWLLFICSAVVASIVTTIFLKRLLERATMHKKPFAELPMPPNCHWLLGHLIGLHGNFQLNQRNIFEKYANEYGQVGFWIGPRRPALCLTKWKDARTILHSEYNKTRIPLMKKHLSMFIGDRQLGAMYGREWKFHRSLVMKAFAPSVVQNLRTKLTIKQVTQTLVNAIQEKYFSNEDDIDVEVILDMEPLAKMVTMDVFGATAFSKQFGCCSKLESSQVATDFAFLGEELSKRMYNPISLPNYFYSWPTKSNRQHYQAKHRLKAFLQDAILERQRLQQQDDYEKNIQDPQEEQDLLSLLLKVHEDSSKVTDNSKDSKKDQQEDMERILGDTMTALLFAGYDTTSITLAYAFYLISRHPDVEQACLDEIEALSTSTSASTSSPDELAYCKGVILETLRMYPPATMVPRTVTKPVPLSGGFVVPKDTHVVIPIWLLQQDETVWPKPDEFRPDRWVKKRHDRDLDKCGDDGCRNIKNTDGVYVPWVEREATDYDSSDISPAFRKAFFAFSGGARSCPGQRFALQEAVLVLAGFLQEFHVQTIAGYKLNPCRCGLVQRPLGGLPMRIIPRRRTRTTTKTTEMTTTNTTSDTAAALLG